MNRLLRGGLAAVVAVAFGLGVVTVLQRTTSPSNTTDRTASVTGLAAARSVLAGNAPIDVLVLGDSTGNDGSEWVALWAEDLSRHRLVEVHRWNGRTSGYERDWRRFGTGGPAVTLWNGSQAGADASYPVEHGEMLQVDPPEIVVLSYGHNLSVEEVPAQLARLHDELVRTWEHAEMIVVLQQPQRDDANADVRREIGSWAGDNGIAVVDVAAAFATAADTPDLLVDAIHPNERGSRLWAETLSGSIAGH